jgi:head-tail adaptor
MSFGKMNQEITLLELVITKDPDGFSIEAESELATVPAYVETQRASERWANLAAFSSADAIFRFRVIPGLTVTSSLFIRYSGKRYRILSAEDVRQRGMYWEVTAQADEPVVG